MNFIAVYIEVHTRFGLKSLGIRCPEKTRRGTAFQRVAYSSAQLSSAQLSSDANIRHGRQTKGKLAAQRHVAKVGRRVMSELKRIERRIMNAGLMPYD